MRWFVRALSVVLAVGLAFAMATVSALASSRPVVSRLSTHRGPYWGETQVTVHGHNFSDVRKVLFGGKAGHGVHVVSPTTLTVIDPGHRYGTVDVRVVTRAGTSSRTRHDRFTFAAPTLDTPIQGGLTARQEQRISAHVRATHRGVHVAHRAARWTAAMGVTAMKRARSWLGLPYSWAGGNASGPTTGVCAHNGGDLDCHVVGFDCSGLALYAWAPYRTMVHFAATQYRTAGSFHPTIGELMPGDLVFFAGYVPHGIGHVAIYAGHGMVIQSPQSGSRVMRSRLADVIAGDGPYRGATRPTSTGKQGIGPGLSSITSRISVHGGNVTITGRRLDSVTSVSVGSTTLYSFVKRTARTLVVRLPARHSGSARVVVANAWATAQRTVQYVAAPHVSRLSTSHGSTAGGNSVTLHGTSLIGLTKVTVGSRSVAFHSLSSRRVTVRMPAHGAGSVRVRVYGRFGASKAKTYVFRAPPAPSPTSPAPTSPAPTSPAPTSPAPTSPAPTSPAPASTPPTSPSPPSPRSTPPSLGP